MSGNRSLKNYNDISNRQRRRKIANELSNIDHDLNTSNSIETVSTNLIFPIPYNIPVPIEPSKNIEPIDMFSVPNDINKDNVYNTFSYNTPNEFYGFSITSNVFNVSTEPLMCNLNNSDSLLSIYEKLCAWTINEKIPLKSVSSLLKILHYHNYNDFKSLPLDARTLLQTPRTTEIRIVHPDGLPISKSSNSQFWPILGSLYHGYNKKPSDIHQFLDDFICETNQLISSGLTYKGQQYNVNVKIFCADAPAKAFIMNVKHHSGYSSCSKCDGEGEYIRNRVCFPDFIGNKKTDIDFLEHKDTDYHQGTSPLEKLQGVFKKMINLWHTGELNVRLSFQNIKQISDT
ncbi:hypothetical protein AGLY_016794 [Aphis glycines]|uniref:DUF4806 domain-containing protein n=1 Tax=Aphis glycines TaxID=307491 RepID=A0A6G0SX41_APHGL|nr:hypothetical protein AGLY_016794 [Aphis glycines]